MLFSTQQLTTTIVLTILSIIGNYFLIVKGQQLTSPSELKLKLVAIVHRHGDRSPLFFLPGDPFADDIYWPDGKSQLLATGKNRLFQLGESLRSYYGHFLTDNPREVQSYSSDANRCLESTSLLLHGLYKASGRWKYNDRTNYLPIPIHTTPKSDDSMLVEGVNCPTLNKELQSVLDRPEAKSFLTSYSSTINEISSQLGIPINDLGSILGLYDVWSIEKSVNYSLPSWLTDPMMSDLESMVDLYSTIQNDSPIIHRLRAGNFFKNLKQYLIDSIYQQSTDQLPKLLTYSTHDTMLGSFMSALKIFNGRRVPYGASLLIELLANPVNQKENYITIKYWNETYVNTQHQLSLPFCSSGQLCPLDQFLNYIEQFIPINWESECGFDQSQPEKSTVNQVNQEEDKAWKIIGIVTVTCLSTITLIICFLFVSFVYNLYRKSTHLNSDSNRSDREKQEYDRIL